MFLKPPTDSNFPGARLDISGISHPWLRADPATSAWDVSVQKKTLRGARPKLDCISRLGDGQSIFHRDLFTHEKKLISSINPLQ